jgi:hypothetical protein
MRNRYTTFSSALISSFAIALCLVSTPASALQSSASTIDPSARVASSANAVAPDAPTPSIPDAPEPSSIGTLRTPAEESPFTLHNRFRIAVHSAFGPSAFIAAADDALIVMAKPPRNFPPEWADGGGAFGRIFGAEFARNATAAFAHFGVAAVDREDPRYHICRSTNYAARTVHALLFTVIDRTESGRPTLALGNLAGSSAAGWVGNAWYPDGFNDNTHALQRSAEQMSSFAIRNLFAEYSPEIVKIAHKMHLPDALANAFLPRGSVEP